MKAFAAQNGWVKDGQYTYYYENGVKVQGFKTIDKKNYFFSYINGSLKKGIQVLNGRKFFLNNDGTVYYGWKTVDGLKMYFASDAYALQGFHRVDNKSYFFSYVHSGLKSGYQYLNNKEFFLNNDGTVYYGWRKDENRTVYYGSDAYALTGFHKIDNKMYFFSTINHSLKSGIQYLNGRYFFLNNDGTVYYGWKDVNGGKMYFASDAYALKGDNQVNGIPYHFNNKDQVGYGWQDYKGTRIYTNKDLTDKNGWYEENGNKYYFENYLAVKGFKDLEGKKRFFSTINYAMKYGWQHLGFDYFYISPEGVVQTTSGIIDGRNYNINANGIVQGFRTVNGKIYYYDPDGTMVKGIQRIGGNYLEFDTDGVYKRTVAQKIVIDVSHHQATSAKGDIDWNKVKNSGKVDGVIVRIGYSTIMDSKAKSFISELNRLGIPYGVYLFSYAENAREAGFEADFVIQALKDAKANISNNLGIFYDLESWSTSKASSNNISKQEYHNMITTFYNKVTSATGKRVGVYASKFYIYDRFLPEDKKYVNWVAHYTKGGLSQPTDYNGTYIGWQFTSTGRVNGITGDVDMSLFYY